jgi:hypothetical protein
LYRGPAYNGGGPRPATAEVNLKTLPAAQLNSTLYNDWGYVQSPACAASDGGASPGSTGAGWGAPWIIDQKTGIAYVNTGNRGPYNGACNPGPDLWASAVMALNDQTGQWVWGFQMSAHDEWDWDCSWQQVLGNETVNGVNTEVLWKTCKTGYLVELNAANGNLIWAYTPPQSILVRAPFCFLLDPLNATQMTEAFFNPSLKDTLMLPSEAGGWENEFSYNPTLNYLFTSSHNIPGTFHYVPVNATNYGKTSGQSAIGTFYGVPGLAGNNGTFEAINAATGQLVWSRFLPSQGYRGGLTSSGNVLFLTLSSGDILMLNAQTGSVVKDLYIGGPLNVVPSVGATASGQMEVVFPITAGIITWGTGVPGDIVALSLQNVLTGSTNTITTTATTTTTVSGGAGATVTTVTTSISTVTASSGGVSSTTLYGVGAVAAIFIIATGYLAMRGRKPAS